MDRRPAGRLVLLLVAVLAVAAAAVVLVSREDDPPLPPVDAGLLPWLPRGELRADAALAAQAAAVWRAGALSDGAALPRSATASRPVSASASVPVPVEETYVLWAGTIGLGRVVVMQGRSADGVPYVAQLSEHGDPARLELDVVEEITDTGPAGLAVTYDGNLDLTGLGVGEGADLVQVLQAPPDAGASVPGGAPGGEPGAAPGEVALWRQGGPSAGDELELLAELDDGMTETFLHIGGPADLPARLVLAAVGARAGIAGTVEVYPGRLLPRPARLNLVDALPWGPSGRIDGGEYLDAVAAAEAVGAQAATVSEIVGGTGIAGGTDPAAGEDVVARLVEVRSGPDAAHRVLLARDAAGEVACLSVDGPFPVSGDETPGSGDRRLVAQQCIEESRGLRVVAVAAPPGAGPAQLTGSSGAAAEPAERLLQITSHSSTAAQPLVAALVGDPSVRVTLPPTGPS